MEQEEALTINTRAAQQGMLCARAQCVIQVTAERQKLHPLEVPALRANRQTCCTRLPPGVLAQVIVLLP
jgi:hypothetical protein